jgi:hypothetical protein
MNMKCRMKIYNNTINSAWKILYMIKIANMATERTFEVISDRFSVVRIWNWPMASSHDDNNKSMYVCTYVRMYVCMYVCMYYVCVCMYVCMYVCVCVCMCIYMYVCMYVCMYGDLLKSPTIFWTYERITSVNYWSYVTLLMLGRQKCIQANR